MNLNRKKLLGKIFLSHSWKDKRFVRQLTHRLWNEGYQVWLDEKELIPGDQLAARLSDAIKHCKVVIIVVTPNSVESSWLKFELNKATERMVKGECRLIPILRGDVDSLSELEGIIYADFRKSFARGFDAVIAALQHEGGNLRLAEWQQLDELINEIFDGKGFTFGGGEYESLDYDFVEISGVKDGCQDSDSEALIILDTVHDYAGSNEQLNDRWWHEYQEVHERYGEKYRLIVTERPVGFKIAKANSPSGKVFTREGQYLDVTVAELAGVADQTKRREILGEAKREVQRKAKPINVP